MSAGRRQGARVRTDRGAASPTGTPRERERRTGRVLRRHVALRHRRQRMFVAGGALRDFRPVGGQQAGHGLRGGLGGGRRRRARAARRRSGLWCRQRRAVQQA